MLRVTEQAATATGFFPVFQKIFKNRRKTVAFFGRYGYNNKAKAVAAALFKSAPVSAASSRNIKLLLWLSR